MKAITKGILTIIFSTIIAYLLGSFYNGTFDFMLWDKESKGLITLILVIVLTTIILTLFVLWIADEE